MTGSFVSGDNLHEQRSASQAPREPVPSTLSGGKAGSTKTIKTPGESRRTASRKNYIPKKKWQILLESLAAGYRIIHACRRARITRETYYKRLHDDAAFAKKAEDAKTAMIPKLEDTLVNLALCGNLEAIKTCLYNRAPERWSNTQRMEGSLGPIPEIVFIPAKSAQDGGENGAS